MQRGRVRRTAAEDDGNFALGYEPAQIEDPSLRGDVLGRNDRALDHEDVEARLNGVGTQLLDPLGREGGRDGDAGRFQLLDPAPDQLGLDGLQIDVLHSLRGLLGLEFGDLLEIGHRIVVPGPETFEVEDAEAAKATDLDGGGGAERSIHGRSHHGNVEPERVELPADVDVFRVASPTTRNNGDVVEPVGTSA